MAKKRTKAELEAILADPEALLNELDALKARVEELTDRVASLSKVTAERDALKARVDELTTAAETRDADEVLIREKMAAGLTRDQAIASITHQRSFDERYRSHLKAKAAQTSPAAA